MFLYANKISFFVQFLSLHEAQRLCITNCIYIAKLAVQAQLRCTEPVELFIYFFYLKIVKTVILTKLF